MAASPPPPKETQGVDKFRALSARIKIKPDTFIKFDGSEHVLLQNIACADGVRIKYDIMLILYELVDWKNVGDLIAPWPPDDQEKILDHLEMMGRSDILIEENELESSDDSESGLSPHLGSRIHINVENHHNMLRDYVRMAAYRRAIENNVTPETVAMDLGCGSGVLSFFTVQAGAKKVYAIERRPDIILLAEELAKANGLDDRIEFIQNSSSHVKESKLSPKPDLLVAEILGNGILEENVLEFTMDARDRLLKPGGRMIPSGLEIYVFAYDSGVQHDKQLEVDELKNLYGLDFSLLGQVLCNKTITRTDRYSPYANKTMSDPACVKTVDFATMKSVVFEERFTLKATRDGDVSAFCAYFNAQLDESTNLTNSPWAPSTHWTQLTFTLPKPKTVKTGDELCGTLTYDGGLRLSIE